MHRKKVILSRLMFLKSLVFLLMILLLACSGAGDKVNVYFDADIGQHAFAAGDIKAALESKGMEVEFRELSALSESAAELKVVITLAGDRKVAGILEAEGGDVSFRLGEQAYALRTTGDEAQGYWVIGGDANGAMYGGLQVAENISFNGFSGTWNEVDTAYIKNRGVKFNIPLDIDAPTYFYGNEGTAHRLAIKDVWDMDFWKTWFDEMARHRYNVLSLWSPHPFTSMLNMEDEYPGIAINGVEGYDREGERIVVNDMTIDEKITFWKEVMAYGRERGFSTYFCTWNIFLSTAEDKHGLTHMPDNALTREYIRKCTRQFFETYPDLAGLGITVGERMSGLSNIEKEEWAWDTYGRGVLEFAEEHPEREIVFIHRQHQGNISHILEYFDPLNKLKNVRFDLSFKYSKAHVHSTPTPAYWESAGMEEGLAANNMKSWLTVRNDDFYFLHWADPRFVRDYILNFPEIDKYVNAFYVGADGWVFTRVFTSKDPYYEERDMLSIQRTWFMQKLWGRIGYNPAVSDDLFMNHLAIRYPEVSVDDLFTAWTSASRAIQLANEQVTGKWKLDFMWWPEGWTSKNGFHSLEDTRKVFPMPGSKLCDFQSTAKGNCGDLISAETTINEVEALAEGALAKLDKLDPGDNHELMLTLNNLSAMAHLSLYNANKYRAALFLEKGDKDEALKAIGIANSYWEKYTDMMDELFIGVDLQRNYNFKDWHQHDKDALQDYLDLGGQEEAAN